MDYEQLLRVTLNDALAKLEYLAISEDLIEINEALRCTAGGYGDVYNATLRGSGSVFSRIVAVKELRAIGDDVTRTRLAIHLARELRIWAGLKHRNVLELIGYSLNPQMTTARFISPFMSNGNIDEFLAKAPSPVSYKLRLVLLGDILNGLIYLHSLSRPICHADIKPENVLITDRVEAVLCDFGLARLTDGPSGLTTTKTIKGSTRYMSPELLEEAAVHTLHSDIWAYGCLILKVMTGSLPYGSARSDQQIVLALALKQPPAELADSGLEDDRLKTLLKMCWDIRPSARPSASECRLHLPVPGTQEPQLPVVKVTPSSDARHVGHAGERQPTPSSHLDESSAPAPGFYDVNRILPPLRSNSGDAASIGLISLPGHPELDHFRSSSGPLPYSKHSGFSSPLPMTRAPLDLSQIGPSDPLGGPAVSRSRHTGWQSFSQRNSFGDGANPTRRKSMQPPLYPPIGLSSLDPLQRPGPAIERSFPAESLGTSPPMPPAATSVTLRQKLPMRKDAKKGILSSISDIFGRRQHNAVSAPRVKVADWDPLVQNDVFKWPPPAVPYGTVKPNI